MNGQNEQNENEQNEGGEQITPVEQQPVEEQSDAERFNEAVDALPETAVESEPGFAPELPGAGDPVSDPSGGGIGGTDLIVTDDALSTEQHLRNAGEEINDDLNAAGRTHYEGEPGGDQQHEEIADEIAAEENDDTNGDGGAAPI